MIKKVLLTSLVIITTVLMFKIGSVESWDVYGNGKGIVQSVITQSSTSTCGTTTMAWDDSIPQVTEGDQYMSVTITPKDANNDLVIEATAFFAQSTLANAKLIYGIFATGTDAIATGVSSPMAVAYIIPVTITKQIKAGVTTPITFTFRAGLNDTATTTFNSLYSDGASRYLGGSLTSFIRVTEIDSN